MKDKREIVHPDVLMQLDLIDDEVRKEHGYKPVTVDEKLDYLRQLLRVFSKTLNWRNQKRYNQATLDVIRSEIEYWESVDEASDVDFSTMKETAIHYFNENENTLRQKHGSGRAISESIIEHLKNVFPNAKNYPKESTLRKDWLKITS